MKIGLPWSFQTRSYVYRLECFCSLLSPLSEFKSKIFKTRILHFKLGSFYYTGFTCPKWTTLSFVSTHFPEEGQRERRSGQGQASHLFFSIASTPDFPPETARCEGPSNTLPIFFRLANDSNRWIQQCGNEAGKPRLCSVGITVDKGFTSLVE